MRNKRLHNLNAPILHVDERVSLEEQIAHRAHELWTQRGSKHGSDWSDWFQAEREIKEWHQGRLNPGLTPKAAENQI
ncbi:MAG TPA: DUF2934 domain-containing protein [Candidatus Acidoferrales bacterium]|nr:DUF2934 domain-containing protein [Candidatus Acidoferrales bacterium]